MKTIVIFNPNSGTAGNLARVQNALEPLGAADVRIISPQQDATALTHAAITEGAELIVAAGGDGTINGVVNGFAPDFSQARLGILPLGTGNDFARAIHVPTDLQAAVDVLVAGRMRAIDVVQVRSDQTCYFINVSAAGFSGLVDEQLTDAMKQTWGPLAYLRSAIAALPDLTTYHTLIGFDDDAPIEVPVYNVVAANGRYVAGGVPIAPEAVLDDGLLDIVLVPRASLPQLATLVPLFLLGKHLNSDLITIRRARHVSIASRPGMWFNVDGELIGNAPVTLDVLPRAIKVIIGNVQTPS